MQFSQGRFEIAKDLLRQASTKQSLRANAQYHLGVIADRQRNISEAINHYSQVRYGRNYIVAASRLSGMLADHRSINCLLYTSPSPRDGLLSRMPSSA